MALLELLEQLPAGRLLGSFCTLVANRLQEYSSYGTSIGSPSYCLH